MNKGFEVLQGRDGHGACTPQPRGGGVERHSLSDVLRLMGMEAHETPETDAYPVTMRQLRAGTALFHEGNVADTLYFVSVGMFKAFTTAEDGYEQVLGFAGRGEVLGFDAVCSGVHPTGAVALEDVRGYALPLRDVFTLGNRVAALDRVLHVAASRQLAQRGELAEMMAAVAAEVRLARFLVRLSARMEACGQSPRRLLLRMSRRDIASHLGVAHETVSRSFGTLAEWGYVHVNYREVEICDLEILKALSRSTRGLIEEPVGRLRRRLAVVPSAPRRAGMPPVAVAA